MNGSHHPFFRSSRSPTWIIPISQFVDQNCLVFEDQEVRTPKKMGEMGYDGWQSLGGSFRTKIRRQENKQGTSEMAVVFVFFALKAPLCVFSRWLFEDVFIPIPEKTMKIKWYFCDGLEACHESAVNRSREWH